MKILVVTQYFWPENFRINDLVSELKNRGHSVTVLTGIPNYPSGTVFSTYRKNPTEFNQYSGVNVKRVSLVPRGKGLVRLFVNYISFVISSCSIGPIKLRNTSPDVIFVYQLSPVTVALPAILLGKIKNAPVVFWALDLWPDTLKAMGVIRSKKLLYLLGQLVKFIYNNCTLVLGQSRNFLPNIAVYCSDQKKIRYFPSWSEDIFDSSDVEPASEIELKENVFTILFAGNVGVAQDMPSVLNAAEKLKNIIKVRWIIIGDGRMSNWLKGEVKRRKLEEEVLVLGRFPIERMPSFYAHADALLVSLKSDPVFSLTIPAKVQSYLLSGVPILGMLDGEGAEVIKESNSGLVCAAGDANGLANAVKTMVEMDEGKRHRLGQNGKTYSKAEFNRRLLMNKLESLLAEAISAHKQRNE